ncbi:MULTISPECIES: helix-turn-helix domain-containing protein [Corynebacterium]|uniref:Helix-turn-helix domain-containing protein n=1 Tax=Corynebacterium hiratae TaxID=3139423 RepID=A0A553FUQ9_9CORY|nr:MULTISPECIES: helix-turn-helix domain-containing protein [Corynebacterium]OFQ58104.1 hypothetical protein HMPREF2932_07395 [Corynebacterium sp. HMSC074H12]TRX60982.1 helix-turn-helix domain-containing protein [Corynebacterium aurimucosum]
MNITRDTYTTNEAAEVIGCKPTTLHTWRHRKTGPKWHRVAGRIRYFKTDVEEWLQAQMASA